MSEQNTQVLSFLFPQVSTVGFVRSPYYWYYSRIQTPRSRSGLHRGERRQNSYSVESGEIVLPSFKCIWARGVGRLHSQSHSSVASSRDIIEVSCHLGLLPVREPTRILAFANRAVLERASRPPEYSEKLERLT